ncbi:MAG: hypothetical protein DMD77_22805, partial [Candidatus Rokuibacteriota bacterium]
MAPAERGDRRRVPHRPRHHRVASRRCDTGPPSRTRRATARTYDSHANYDELLPLVARGKRNPARLVTRQIALRDVTDTLQRMTRFETAGFGVITR